MDCVLWGSFVFGVITFFYGWDDVSTVRSVSRSGEKITLRSNCLVAKNEEFMSGEFPHFSKFIPRSESARLLHVDGGVYEVDTSISRHLLDGGIYCRIDHKGNFFHFDTREILAQSEDFKSEQIDVLNIRCRNAARKGGSLFDAKKISLGCIELVGDELQAELGTTTYFCSMVTNDASTKVISSEDGTEVNTRLLRMFPAIGHMSESASDIQYVLEEIGDTRGLSNHIGSMVLAISSDNVPIICIQGGRAAVNVNKAVPSGAGSVEFGDFRNSGADKSGHLEDVIRFGMARELLEETSAIRQDSSHASDLSVIHAFSKRIQVAGFYRDLRRGAFPIFFGFCRMDEDFETICNRVPPKTLFSQPEAETEVDGNVPRDGVFSTSDLQDFLSEYCATDSGNNPSDQIHLYLGLLDLDAVSEHFQRILDQSTLFSGSFQEETSV